MIQADRYRQITGDFASTDAEVERCITDATELLEGYLNRPLALLERTEEMRPDRRGRLWPKATPITESASYEIDGLALTGTAPFGPLASFIDPVSFITVEYTGGWQDERAVDWVPGATPALPYCIARDIAFAANRMANPAGVTTATGFPAGATSVRLGDAAVTFGTQGPGAAQDTSSWWSRTTRGYRYMPVHSGPDAHVLAEVSD